MLGFTLYYEGELSYYESISKEAISNGIELFLTMNIIVKHTVDEKGLTIIKLHNEYQDEEKLLSLIERVGAYRREGKYASNTLKLTQPVKDVIKLTVPAKSISKL